MKLSAILPALAAVVAVSSSAVLAKEPPTKLQIGVKHRPSECPIKSQSGDKLAMHYTGKLWNGEKFDSSLDRGQPFEFTLGTGQVIGGWDKGLLDMCEGEKRKLQIPPQDGYGDRGAGGKIPGGATLVFDVELLQVQGKRADAARSAAGVTKEEL
ncbi:unnamed protein product [Sympodiomycopsis kandeliae]